MTEHEINLIYLIFYNRDFSVKTFNFAENIE